MTDDEKSALLNKAPMTCEGNGMVGHHASDWNGSGDHLHCRIFRAVFANFSFFLVKP